MTPIIFTVCVAVVLVTDTFVIAAWLITGNGLWRKFAAGRTMMSLLTSIWLFTAILLLALLTPLRLSEEPIAAVAILLVGASVAWVGVTQRVMLGKRDDYGNHHKEKK